jgi:hypothetical protein
MKERGKGVKKEGQGEDEKKGVDINGICYGRFLRGRKHAKKERKEGIK